MAVQTYGANGHATGDQRKRERGRDPLVRRSVSEPGPSHTGFGRRQIAVMRAAERLEGLNRRTLTERNLELLHRRRVVVGSNQEFMDTVVESRHTSAVDCGLTPTD